MDGLIIVRGYGERMSSGVYLWKTYKVCPECIVNVSMMVIIRDYGQRLT